MGCWSNQCSVLFSRLGVGVVGICRDSTWPLGPVPFGGSAEEIG